MFQISKGFLRIIKILISCGRNVIFLHEIFGKCFGTFQNCRIFPRSEDAQSLCLKHIHDTAYQRVIHTDDRQVDLFFFCKCCQFIELHGSDIHALRILCDSCISRCTVDLLYLRALCNLPCQCMFSSAASNNQNFHMNASLIVQSELCRPLLSLYRLLSDQWPWA